MATERMACCGALTKVYADAGNRQHNPDCEWARPKTKTGRVLTDEDIQALADEAEQGYDVSHLLNRKGTE